MNELVHERAAMKEVAPIKILGEIDGDMLGHEAGVDILPVIDSSTGIGEPIDVFIRHELDPGDEMIDQLVAAVVGYPLDQAGDQWIEKSRIAFCTFARTRSRCRHRKRDDEQDDKQSKRHGASPSDSVASEGSNDEGNIEEKNYT